MTANAKFFIPARTFLATDMLNFFYIAGDLNGGKVSAQMFLSRQKAFLEDTRSEAAQ